MDMIWMVEPEGAADTEDYLIWAHKVFELLVRISLCFHKSF